VSEKAAVCPTAEVGSIDPRVIRQLDDSFMTWLSFGIE
jgi:hypothetical protein